MSPDLEVKCATPTASQGEKTLERLNMLADNLETAAIHVSDKLHMICSASEPLCPEKEKEILVPQAPYFERMDDLLRSCEQNLLNIGDTIRRVQV